MDNRREEKNGCTDYCIFSTNLDRRFRWPHYECYNLIESAQPQWDVRQSKSIEAWTKNSSSTSQATMGLVWHGTVTRMGILITCVSLSYHPAYSLNIQNLWLGPHNTPGNANVLNNSWGRSFVGDFPYFFSCVEFKTICFVFPRGGVGRKMRCFYVNVSTVTSVWLSAFCLTKSRAKMGKLNYFRDPF